MNTSMTMTVLVTLLLGLAHLGSSSTTTLQHLGLADIGGTLSSIPKHLQLHPGHVQYVKDSWGSLLVATSARGKAFVQQLQQWAASDFVQQWKDTCQDFAVKAMSTAEGLAFKSRTIYFTGVEYLSSNHAGYWLQLLAAAACLMLLVYCTMTVIRRLLWRAPRPAPVTTSPDAVLALAWIRALIDRLVGSAAPMWSLMPLFAVADNPDMLRNVQQRQVHIVAKLLGHPSLVDAMEGICNIPGVEFVDNPTVEGSADHKQAAKQNSVAMALILLQHMTATEARNVSSLSVSGVKLLSYSFARACTRMYKCPAAERQMIWDSVLDPVTQSVFGENHNLKKNQLTAAYVLVGLLMQHHP